MPLDQEARVLGHGEHFPAPILVQSDERADAEPPGSRPCRAFRCTEAPRKEPLVALQVVLRIHTRVVGLLVDDDAVAPRVDERAIGVLVPYLYFDGDVWHD